MLYLVCHMPEINQEYFNVSQSGEKLTLVFHSASVANEFGRMDFYSRILHSLKPDELRIWRVGDRLDLEIKGWPKNIKWTRISDKEFEGIITSQSEFSIEEYASTLDTALKGMLVGEMGVNSNRINVFEIGKGNNWKKYKFYSKARTIAALCVLYDLEPHPRNDLEINVPNFLKPHWVWPLGDEQESVLRIYGDPSKTADVLRNEGWSREGNAPGIQVFNQTSGGTRQQMYQLMRQEQDITQQVMRTNIPERWKKELYESQDYTCRICGLKYEYEFLSPDHRVPVIFQADELNNDNFKVKLMTLCRFCNQQKREFCKRIAPDYDWENSPWAYPEKFAMKKIKNEIQQFAVINKLSLDEVLQLIKEDNS